MLTKSCLYSALWCLLFTACFWSPSRAQEKSEVPPRAASTGIFHPAGVRTIWTYGGNEPIRLPYSSGYDKSPAAIPEPDRKQLVTEYKNQTEKDPNDSRAFYNLGVAYSALGDTESAVKAFAKAIALKPDWSVAHYNLANAYADLGKHSQAIEEYTKTIKLDPKVAEAFFNLALSYLASGNVESAKEQYKNLKSLDAKEAPGAETLAAQLEKALKL